MGHEHYASLIGKIRSEFFTNVDDESQENITALVTGKRESKHIWPELFFTSDIAIVGLGLDYSEIDLWWLLSMRAALFSPNIGLIEKKNRVNYYQINLENKKSQYESGKQTVLGSLGVQVEIVPANSFLEGYKKITNRIKDTWS